MPFYLIFPLTFKESETQDLANLRRENERLRKEVFEIKAIRARTEANAQAIQQKNIQLVRQMSSQHILAADPQSSAVPSPTPAIPTAATAVPTPAPAPTDIDTPEAIATTRRDGTHLNVLGSIEFGRRIANELTRILPETKDFVRNAP